MCSVNQRRFWSQRSCFGPSWLVLAALLSLFLVAGDIPTFGETRPGPSKLATSQKKASPEASPPAEIQTRAAAVQTARESGDPQAISKASRALIAVALRQMGHLRLVEGAFSAAVDLYQQSLAMEDNPSTRVDLAVTYLRARRPEDSLTETAKAIIANPEDPRGWRVQGLAYMMKNQYGSAAESLQRSLALSDDLEAAYSLGICLLSNHDKDGAAAVFKKMDEEAANRGALHVLMARAYRDANYLDDAVRELRIALQLNPKTAHAHYLLGVVYLLQEQWAPKPKIREEFLAELKLNPRDFLSNYLLGAMASNEKNFDESDHYLKVATDINPDWSEPWLYLGLNANDRGDTQHAEEYLRKAIQLNGTDDSRSNYLIRKAYFALGRILNDQGRKEEARTCLQKARELQERVQADSLMTNSDAPGMGGGKEALLGRSDFKNAESNAASELEPADSAAELDVATLARANLTEDEKQAALAQEKNLRELLGASYNDLATSEAMRQLNDLALEHYQQAQRWQPDTPGLARNLGITAAKVHEYQSAIPALSHALSENPQDNPARAMLGMSYYFTADYKNASATISPLGDVALQDPALAYAWADSLAKSGDFEPASKILDKLEAASLPNDKLMLVGQTWEEIGNHQRAIATYHRILQTSPSQPKAHYYAGIAYIKSDRPTEAAAEFQEELALSPQDEDSVYHLGYAYLMQSKRDQAETLFRQVISSHPEHADAQYQLGKILLDEGKVKEAISHLEEAVRLSPETDYMHYQLQAAYRMDSRIQDADRELAVYKGIKSAKRERQSQEMGHD